MTVQSGVTRQRVVERVEFRGHPLIRALHPTTLEITTEPDLTEKGDCIVGVSSQKSPSSFAPMVRDALASNRPATLRLCVGKEVFTFRARGDGRLTLTDSREIVVRKSSYISPRTVAILADAAAGDVPRTMVRRLRHHDTIGILEIEVSC